MPVNFSFASSEEEVLAEALELYKKCEFEKACQILEKLAQSPKLEKETLKKVYKYLAFSYSILGEKDKAIAVFVKLLKLAPSLHFDEKLTLKEILDAFREAQARIKRDNLVLDKELEKKPPPKEPLLIKAKQEENKLTNWLLNLAPLGIPQFKNKKKWLGISLFSIQTSSLASAIIAHNQRESLRIKKPDWDPECGKYTNPAEAEKLQNIQRVTFALFLASYLYSVIESWRDKK